MDISGSRQRTPFHGKVLVMILFLIMDLGLNSILDYDILNDQRDNNILLGVFGLQVVIQISIFLILFLATADTYLFRVGLLGILIRTISLTILVHPVYMALTIGVGSYRVNRLSGSGTLSTLWKDDTFITISFIQKISKWTCCTKVLTFFFVGNWYLFYFSCSCHSILHFKHSRYNQT
jgi:hypothetical protein